MARASAIGSVWLLIPLRNRSGRLLYNQERLSGVHILAPDIPATFVSYCRSDSEFVLRLVQDLKAVGVNVWLDQLDIAPGAAWDISVEAALFSCPSMLVILSSVSVSSENVRDEVSFALSKQKQIIPVLYRDCDVPFRLARLQHIDFRTDYARGLERLQNVLGAVPQPEAPPVVVGDEPVASSVVVGDKDDSSVFTTPKARPVPDVQSTSVSTRDSKEDESFGATTLFDSRLGTISLAVPRSIKISIFALAIILLRVVAIKIEPLSLFVHYTNWGLVAAYIFVSSPLLSAMLLWLKAGLKVKHAVVIASAWILISFFEILPIPWPSFQRDLPFALKIALCWIAYGSVLGLVLAVGLHKKARAGFGIGAISFGIPGLLRAWFAQILYDYATRGALSSDDHFFFWLHSLDIVPWSMAVGAFLWFTRLWE